MSKTPHILNPNKPFSLVFLMYGLLWFGVGITLTLLMREPGRTTTDGDEIPCHGITTLFRYDHHLSKSEQLKVIQRVSKLRSLRLQIVDSAPPP
jgi:hypothetical protein